MRKFTTAFALICTVGAACFLGACSKNCDTKCSGDSACCKEKAAVKMESEGAPAAKTGCCKEKAAVKMESEGAPAAKSGCAKSCTGAKKVCPATGASN